MNPEQLKQYFYDLVHPDLPNEWEVEEVMEPLLDLDPAVRSAVLEQVQVIWPVSNSLCYSYLHQAIPALACIKAETLGRWASEALEIYERSGLKDAQQFMINVQSHFACRMDGQGQRFKEIAGRMEPYLRGLARRDLRLESSKTVFTDTRTVFLPEELSLFQGEGKNFLLYKLTTSFQWAFIALDTFLVTAEPNEINPSAKGKLWLHEYLAATEFPSLLATLYFLFETVRARGFLERELPGLMRDSSRLFASLDKKSPCKSGVERIVSQTRNLISGQLTEDESIEDEQIRTLLHSKAVALDSLRLAEQISHQADEGWESIVQEEPLFFQGRMELTRVEAARMVLRREQEAGFVEALATFFLSLPTAGNDTTDEEAETEDGAKGVSEADAALLFEEQSSEGKKEESSKSPDFTRLENELELSEELQELAEEIKNDLGQVPDQYISAAMGKAGQAQAGMGTPESDDGSGSSAPVTYDEWDYRRAGFRRNWCVVTEKQLEPIQSNFIRDTLEQYKGLRIRLRRQFEMMQTRERFVRRQRDGDEIDLDALVESLADTAAGFPPSDRLFIRLKRDERDIAVMFLVDMSNSTRGWVGTAIKQSLILLSEAMETLGDRYGIYGFSGMRRLRCELFPIKGLDEPYNDEVRTRISSIAPREYTRMAPALRHIISIMKKVDAGVRLIITLSDGKPEDYDNYNGEYAIEDTRHALIEARMAGIHPFCITIDQHAHEYMPRYGEVNYIFINDVAKLPARIPEIYRVLTS